MKPFETIKTNSTIRVPQLTAFSVDDANAVALAEGLKGNSSLEVLKLSCNEIGEVGAAAVAGRLTRN